MSLSGLIENLSSKHHETHLREKSVPDYRLCRIFFIIEWDTPSLYTDWFVQLPCLGKHKEHPFPFWNVLPIQPLMMPLISTLHFTNFRGTPVPRRGWMPETYPTNQLSQVLTCQEFCILERRVHEILKKEPFYCPPSGPLSESSFEFQCIIFMISLC